MKNTSKNYILLGFIAPLFMGLNLQSTGQINPSPSSPRSPCDYATIAYNAEFDHKSPSGPTPSTAEALDGLQDEEELLQRLAAINDGISALTMGEGQYFFGSDDEDDFDNKDQSGAEESEEFILLDLPHPVLEFFTGPSNHESDDDSDSDFTLN